MREGDVLLASLPQGGFRTSGLKAASLIRLGYLAVLPRSEFKGRIGSVSAARRNRLLTKLSDFLLPPAGG
jgi:mRNA interferase MazF